MSLKSDLVQLTNGLTYRRTGECDSCQRPGITPGQCCTYVQLPLARDLTADERKWVELHGGILIVETPEGQAVRIAEPCTALSEDGRCVLFGSPIRPEMCEDFPQWPGSIKGLPQGAGSCAYKFELINKEE